MKAIFLVEGMTDLRYYMPLCRAITDTRKDVEIQIYYRNQIDSEYS